MNRRRILSKKRINKLAAKLNKSEPDPNDYKTHLEYVSAMFNWTIQNKSPIRISVIDADKYYARNGVVPKSWRTYSKFSTIMLNSSLYYEKLGFGSAIEFLVSNQKEISNYMRRGLLPKRVRMLIG